MAAILFWFFAFLAPAVGFGGLFAVATDGAIAAIEMISSTAICGLIYSLFSAQPASDKKHGAGKFDLGTETQCKKKAMAPRLTSIFANTLIEAATEDRAIVGITAAMHAGRNKNRYFWKTIPQAHKMAGLNHQHIRNATTYETN